MILTEIERQGEKSFIPVIGPKKGQILDDVVRESKPRIILEVGTYIGFSAIRMASLVSEDAKIVTIEMNVKSAEIAKSNIEKVGFSKKIKIIVGDAKKVIKTLDEIFDLVFLDAEKYEYLTYLKLVERKLHKGSRIVADNAGVFATEMKNYLDYVRESRTYRSRYYESTLEFRDDIKDGVEVSVRL